MHALVTGARGFVGRHLCRRLRDDGWDVVEVDVKGRPRLDCREFFKRASYGFDLVVHLAAIVGGRATIDGEPMSVATDLAIDSDFFQYLLRTRPARAVYFSSSAAYPTSLQTGDPTAWVSGRLHRLRDGGMRLREDDIDLGHAAEPDAIYGWVKLTGERLARHVQDSGVNLQVYRPFSGYGADQDLDYPFPTFIQRALNRENPFVIWGDPRSTRDWIHIDDIAELVMRGLDLGPGVGPINLCTGDATTFGDLASLCTEAVGYSPKYRLLSDAPRGVMHRVGDPELMRQMLDSPRIDIREGVDRAIREAKLVRR